MKICILGAAGCGTTTIGKFVSKEFDCAHMESDFYSWEQTDPPFTIQRPKEEALKLLEDAICQNENLVISGNVAKWREHFANSFDVVVFLTAPVEVRRARILDREKQLYGSRVLPGGDMYENLIDFLWYVDNYETGDESFRSLKLQKKFLNMVHCPVIEVDTNKEIQEILNEIYINIRRLGKC